MFERLKNLKNKRLISFGSSGSERRADSEAFGEDAPEEEVQISGGQPDREPEMQEPERFGERHAPAGASTSSKNGDGGYHYPAGTPSGEHPSEDLAQTRSRRERLLERLEDANRRNFRYGESDPYRDSFYSANETQQEDLFDLDETRAEKAIRWSIRAGFILLLFAGAVFVLALTLGLLSGPEEPEAPPQSEIARAAALNLSLGTFAEEFSVEYLSNDPAQEEQEKQAALAGYFDASGSSDTNFMVPEYPEEVAREVSSSDTMDVESIEDGIWRVTTTNVMTAAQAQPQDDTATSGSSAGEAGEEGEGSGEAEGGSSSEGGSSDDESSGEGAAETQDAPGESGGGGSSGESSVDLQVYVALQGGGNEGTPGEGREVAAGQRMAVVSPPTIVATQGRASGVPESPYAAKEVSPERMSNAELRNLLSGYLSALYGSDAARSNLAQFFATDELPTGSIDFPADGLAFGEIQEGRLYPRLDESEEPEEVAVGSRTYAPVYDAEVYYSISDGGGFSAYQNQLVTVGMDSESGRWALIAEEP